ncbi:STE3-domain-containing protein [Rickenella mellea]|uniref:STE3-domain-containing protein n=1 Tax=Rickenella mellea TaxID=50990 RepID=A0A4Y7PXF1_9AGAM|nr:STE3-domain-containing protein [Rickenella mellea]
MELTYPLYPVVSFLCLILVLVPLPLHWQLRNAGTSMYIIWTATSCFILFVNSIIWHNNAIDKAPVWCDISGRILLGLGIGIPACALCIQRRLYLATQIVITNQKEKMKNFIQDLFITLGFPLLVMALVYIVQDHRYDIYEDFGCTTPIYNVWPAYPIYNIWPVAIGLVSLCYSVLNLRAFVKRRSELNEFLNSGIVGYNRHHDVRLMCLAGTDIAFTIPLSVWVLVSDIRSMKPYVSWEDLHHAFSVRTYPDIVWRNDGDLRFIVEVSRWIIILCALIFIVFFTFTEESRRKYCLAFDAVVKRLGWSHLNETKSPARKHRLGTLPPMFPSDRITDGTFMSTNTADVVDEMAERERMVAPRHLFDSISTMESSNPKVGPHIAPHSTINNAICTLPLPSKLERGRSDIMNTVH